MTGQDICAMCSKPTPADHGLLCKRHRAEDDKITALRPANSPGVAHVFSDECRCGDCREGGVP